MRLPALLVLLLLSVLAAGSSYAATLTVTKTADTMDGSCDASDCSLREAVADAASGDTIVFSQLFDTPQIITITLGQIELSKNLTIIGTGQELVTISGNHASRIFLIGGQGISVEVSNVAFRDGNSGASFPYGGAIAVNNGSLLVSNASFINNRAVDPISSRGAGGAIWGAEGSSLELSNVIVAGNDSAQSGGQAISGYLVDIRDSVVKQNMGGGVGAGILRVERSVISDNTIGGVSGQRLTIAYSFIVHNATLGGVACGVSSVVNIDHSLISRNSRIRGGGGIISSGTTIISDSRITANTAVGMGGGIYNDGTLYLINSTVSGNTVQTDVFGDNGGGGIINEINPLFLINSTISGNSTTGKGGGVYNKAGGHVYMTNSTIAANISSGAGGGARIEAEGVVSFTNSIVAGNSSTGTVDEDVSGVITSNGINLIGNTVGSSGWISGDLLDLSPMLSPLGNNGGGTLTHALLPGSPAINAGNNALAIDPRTGLPLAQDQRGHQRVSGRRVDIGSYEASYSASPVTVGGRMTTYSGRGIERTQLKIDDGKGRVFYTQTNPFGYFRILNLVPGNTYTVSITNKLYLFTSPQFFTADQDRDDLNFIASL